MLVDVQAGQREPHTRVDMEAMALYLVYFRYQAVWVLQSINLSVDVTLMKGLKINPPRKVTLDSQIAPSC